jgi:hypothetical protein
MTTTRRVLVATDHERCPRTALSYARDLAGAQGEVVLAAVLVVPLAQPLDAALERGVSSACGVLDEAERTTGDGGFDTRIVRARSLADGVLGTLAGEPFDLVLLEKARDTPLDGWGAQIATLLEKAQTTVVLVRPV